MICVPGDQCKKCGWGLAGMCPFGTSRIVPIPPEASKEVNQVSPPSSLSGCCEGQVQPTFTDLWQHFRHDMAAFIASGMRLSPKPQRKTRLAVCDQCDQRQEHHFLGLRLDRCNVCGCFIALRARGQAWNCPAGKWPTSFPPVLPHDAPLLVP